MIDVNGTPQPSTTQMFWAGYSGHVLICPRPSRRPGSPPAGLPVGVQIVGPQYGDYRTIEVARLVEKDYFAFTPPPGYD